MDGNHTSSFTLTDDQKAVLEAVEVAVRDRTRLAIQGYAGTGKTFVMSRVIETYQHKFPMEQKCSHPQNATKMVAVVDGKERKVYEGEPGMRWWTEGGIIGLAPTHAAAQHLHRVTGIQTFTVHSALGARPDEENPGETKLSGRAPLRELCPDIVILDEAGAVPDKLLKILCGYHTKKIRAVLDEDGELLPGVSPADRDSAPPFALIMVGDRSQLAPIGQWPPEPTFDQHAHQIVTLSEIVRQAADSPIITVSSRYRISSAKYRRVEKRDQSWSKGEGVAVATNQIDKASARRRFLNWCSGSGGWRPNDTVFLSATNKNVDAMNRSARWRVHGDDAALPYLPDEKVRAYATLMEKKTVNGREMMSPLILNTQVVTILGDFGAEDERIPYIDEKGVIREHVVTLHDLVVRTEDHREISCKANKATSRDRDNLVKPIGRSAWMLQKMLRAELDEHGLWKTWKSKEDKSAGAFDKFCTENNLSGLRVLESEPFYAALEVETIQKLDQERRRMFRTVFELGSLVADFRPPYASTIHKAQGLTYNTVYFDTTGIIPVEGKKKGWTTSDCNRLAYTALTRASHRLIVLA